MSYHIFTHCEIALTHVECLDDGEIGKAEPYLWAAFFKIDGMQTRLNINRDTNIGKFELKANQTDYAIVEPPLSWTSAKRNGHGNIGGGMKGGQTRRLTNIEVEGRNPFKWYFGDLIPIPIYYTTHGVTTPAAPTNAPGIIGCIAVLMEEDYTPNSAVLEGYRALLSSLPEGFNTLMEEFEFDFVQYIIDALGGDGEISIPEEAIDDLRTSVGREVYSAVKNKVKNGSFWDKILAYTDSDDSLGTGVWYFTSDEMPTLGSTKIFSSDVWTPEVRNPYYPAGPRWLDGGRWRVRGSMNSRKCFVATAVYESSCHPNVLFLQNWRDNFLSKAKFGQKFIQTYYRCSPSVAGFISNSSIMRRISKRILDTLVILIDVFFHRR